MEANRPALFRLSSTCLTSLQSQSVNVSSKTRCFLRGPTQIYMNPFCKAAREDPKAMAEHNCPVFLPQRSSKLSTSTTTVQNECELKSAPICSPRRQFGAKLCEYVPFMCKQPPATVARRTELSSSNREVDKHPRPGSADSLLSHVEITGNFDFKDHIDGNHFLACEIDSRVAARTYLE